MKTGNRIEPTTPKETKSCSLADMGNILVNSVSKAVFIDGLASIILNGHFNLKSLTTYKVALDAGSAFVSYVTREYATKCVDDMQYAGGVAGGMLKYEIKVGNPILGAINNLGYEVCNYHKLNPNICAITLETGEEVVKSLLGMDQTPIANAFFNGITISAVLIASVYTVYLPADEALKGFVKNTTDYITDMSSFIQNESDAHLIGENHVEL